MVSGQDKNANGQTQVISNKSTETCAWCGSVIPPNEGFLYRCWDGKGRVCSVHSKGGGVHYMCINHKACKKRVMYNLKSKIHASITDPEYKPLKRKNIQQGELF